MPTARDTTSSTMISDTDVRTIISSFAHVVSGMVSVGLKAVAWVKATYK
ncbi:hypothetical protein ACFWBN_11765 [Streptomyces sp. NPDC059989]